VQLNWLALLAGFMVTMKVYWMAMWLRPVRKDSLK
jgi:ATP synthase protein I